MQRISQLLYMLILQNDSLDTEALPSLETYECNFGQNKYLLCYLVLWLPTGKKIGKHFVKI